MEHTQKLIHFGWAHIKSQKKIGPVNWGIIDLSTKKTKIVHHDLLKPALEKQDASGILSYKKLNLDDRADKQHSSKIYVYLQVIEQTSSKVLRFMFTSK